jgi:hypothetical protein
MKRIAFLFIMVSVINLTVKSQYEGIKEYYTHYGVNVSQIHSGSGHGDGIVVNVNVRKERKSLEAGAIFKTSENKIAGADIRYKIFLGHFNDFLNGEKLFSPYFQYNLVYQKAIINVPVIVTTGKKKIELPDSWPGIVTTIEHYVSLGLQLKIYKHFYFDSSLGLGIYIGSIDKKIKPTSLGIHKENYGFTSSYKLGIGYRLR